MPPDLPGYARSCAPSRAAFGSQINTPKAKILSMALLMIDRIGYRYRPISAIILYGCNSGKYLNVLRNAINVAPQSHCDTYSAEMVSKRDYGMYLPGL